MSFNPPTSPTNGSEYTYGNVVWEYQNPPGVWNIKNGALVGSVGQGVSGFRLIGNDLYFHYLYSGGATSPEFNLGQVVFGPGAAFDNGITFMDFNDSISTGQRVALGEYFSITGSDTGTRPGIRITTNVGKVGSITSLGINASVNLASVSATGVAQFAAADFNVNGVGLVELDDTKRYFGLQDQLGLTSDMSLSNQSTLRTFREISLTGGNGVEVFKNTSATTFHQIRFLGATATYTTPGTASFRASDFSVVSGAVSLTANIVNSVNGKTGSVVLPLADTDGTTGLASFHSPHFIVSATGNVQSRFFTVNDGGFGGPRYISPGSVLTVRGENSNQTISVKAPAGANNILDIGITDASYSVKGAALFRAGDFVVSAGSVSLTANIVNSINGATGNLLVGAGDDRIVFTNTNPAGQGLSASPNFLFDGNTLTFGGANTQMTITGPTFAFGDLTKVKGGVYTMFSESATAFSDAGSVAYVDIDPRDGTIQKIKKTNWAGVGSPIRVRVKDTGWSIVPDTVQSVVVYLQQIGSGRTGEFDPSIISDKSTVLFGVTGGIDVFTISRYAVGSNAGLTMGFSIAAGLTGVGLAF